MLGFLDFIFNDTTLLLSIAALCAGAGALLTGWAALIRARAQGRAECCAKGAANG